MTENGTAGTKELSDAKSRIRNAAIELAEGLNKFVRGQEKLRKAVEAGKEAGLVGEDVDDAILEAGNTPERKGALERYAAGGYHPPSPEPSG
jgi:hypothetical protein